jgi:hypothetical protein
MSEWRDRLKLADGETLILVEAKLTGFMQESDVEMYNVVAPDGAIRGTVVATDHTAVKGFRRTLRVVQRDAAGETIVDEAWIA